MEKAIRILMLEDEPRDYELVGKALERSGLKFSAARVETERDFLQQLAPTPPDVVLSDHGLPQFDGMRALKLVRRIAPETPFIFVAGALGEQTVIESFDLGATDYVLKDRLGDLAPAIERALQRKRALSGPTDYREFNSREIFQCAVEQARESVVITSADLDKPGPTILFVNRAFTNMTGYAADEVVGKTPRILQGPKTDRSVLDDLKAKLRRGEPFQGETFNYRKGGEPFILQWEISPIRDIAGRITHFVSVQRDVTERRERQSRQMELTSQTAHREAGEAEERRVSQILNRITDAFVCLDREWRYVFVNEKAGQIFGRKPEDLIGKHIWSEFPEGIGQPFHEAYVKAFAEQKPISIEEFYEPYQKWFENRIYPSPEGLSIFFQDVTETRSRHDELKASLERFELASRVVQDVIYDYNLVEGTIHWNQNYYSVFQHDSSMPERNIELWSGHLHPDDRVRVEASLTAALEGKANFWQSEYRFERGDGSYAEVADRGYIIRDATGKATRMVGGMMDISVQKQHNRSLNDTTRRVTSILESITDAFYSLDREWRFTYVNRQAEQLLMRPREELIGRNIWREFPEATETIFQREYHRAVNERTTIKFETYYEPFSSWFFVTAYPSPEGLSVYFHDVTDRKRADEALRATEEFNRRIIESSSDCINVLDLEGRLIGMTEGGQRLMEIPDLLPLLGKRWTDFWKGKDREEARKALADAQNGGGGRFQGGCPTVAGKPKYWDVICTPILDASGKVERILAVSRDITDLKKAEEDRRALLARQEAIVSSAIDAILTIDHESRVQDWNPAAEKIFGYKKEDVLGKSMVELIIPPELRERHRAGMKRSLQSSERWLQKRYELPALRADGTTFPAEISISRTPSDGPPLFTGFVRDISERKRAEKQLRDQEERLRLIVENAQDYAIFTLDMNGRVTTWNTGAEKILQYSREEIIGKSGSVIFTPQDLSQRADEAELERALKTGVSGDERWHLRKGGQLFWASGLMRALKDENGAVRGFLKILRDDTERRQARDEIERLNAELEERVRKRTFELEAANRELEAFSYSVSHDLRAPLRHIIAFIEMLDETARPKLDEDEKHYVQTVIGSAQKMSDLINDLLSFSRMLRTEVKQTTFALHDLVKEVIESFAFETRGRDVQWRLEPLPTVEGDEAMLRQVMINLLSNALKYSRRNKIAEVTIGAVSRESEVVIFVKDNGVGFDTGQAGRLFGVFQRLHSEQEFEGTGVGLANVRRIIERHGGRVWAESETGKGATFYFSLPKKDPVKVTPLK